MTDVAVKISDRDGLETSRAVDIVEKIVTGREISVGGKIG